MRIPRALFTCAAVLLVAVPAAAAERPNVLWLVAEDLPPRLGCYGDALARTPTLDRLAAAGVVFERCYAQPVCAPSRFTLVTGLPAAACGPAQHMRASATLPPGVAGFPELLRRAGYHATNNAKTDYNTALDLAATWDASSKRATYRDRPDPRRPFFAVFNHETTHESCLFPETDELPFAATPPAAVTLPPYLPDTPELRADLARQYDRIALLDRQIAEKLAELEASGEADDTIVFFYGDNGGVLPRSKRFLHSSGTRVPLIVRFPPKWAHLAPAAPGSRIADPVGFVDFAPTVLALAGVPVPAALAGRPFAGPSRAANEYVFTTRDRMDERQDMVRAVMDRRWLYIRNFRPDLPFVQPLAYMFRARGYRSWAREARAGTLTAATAAYWGEKPTEELYDIDADPGSTVNLAADPAHAATLERLRGALRGQMLRIRDNGLVPEGSAAEGFAAARDDARFPVERTLDAAWLAGECAAAARGERGRGERPLDVADGSPATPRSPASPQALDALGDGQLARLEALVADPAEPVRWWAAQGLTMLAKRAEHDGDLARRVAAALLPLLGDPSGAVQVAAAEGLVAAGQGAAALPALGRQIEGPNPWFAVAAGNVVDRLGAAARPLEPVLARFLARPEQRLGEKRPAAVRYPGDIAAHALAVIRGETEPLVHPRPAATAPAHARDAADPPWNVVFILADDLGWTDLAVQGSGYYRTPALDRLAADGTRFLAHHSCPNCQPTRAALLTGQYPPRTGVYTVGGIDRFDWKSRPLRPVDNVVKLPLDRQTLADALRGAGRATALFGKWHLGDDDAHHPLARGFDEALVSMGKHFGFETKPPVDHPPGEYLADFLTDRACDFIRRHAAEPFFLYVPHFAVHGPHDAKEELVARFRDLPAVGGHHDPVYAAMIASVDESVARIRRQLEESGIARRTVVIFSSDNGGVGGYVREGLRESGGVTDNLPLRSGKGSLYEGGTRVPLLVSWPGVTPAGTTCSVPTIHVDVFPTLLEIAGAPPPAQPLDGVSLVPLLRDPRATLDRDGIYQHFPGYLGADERRGTWRTTPVGSIIAGDWKLLEFFEDGHLELYDLAADPGETRNLVEREPARAADLHRRLVAWRERVGAKLPTANEPAAPARPAKAGAAGD
ncbi:MAG: sulfatase-like hydrolase/transferase [Planctomycetes bacterium]|nr:sulfatase-like hydrolase/transferase [Planctomycetota bacterium]